MTRIIALANQKGGVGKTTTTLNLGAALAERGRRVLLVDLDPQSNLTMGLGINPNDQEQTTYDVLLNPMTSPSVAIVTITDTLALIPATLDMAAAELELAGQIGREFLLRDALSHIIHRYEFILIDSPPSLGLFTLNALTAATEVLIPVQLEVYSLKGLAQLQRTIGLVQRINPQLEIGGILCTMVDRRKNLALTVEARIRELFGDLVYQHSIPDNVRLAEAPGAGQPILTYDSTSTGAQAYRALAEEVDYGQA
ncbi:MAG: ParA family protein [Chloroflexaceae bacterium]|nr:ParA family protein [Chloroflexaceae bacterium]